MTDREKLLQLLATNSFKRGDFLLSSGLHSSYYVDARLTTMSPEGLRVIGATGFEALGTQGWRPDSIGGLTLGADPVAYAISYFSATTPMPIRAFTVRKEPKAHGARQQIEGPFQPSDRCVVIEDVVTTGASALRAIEVVRQAGARILGVLAVIDREEGGREEIERHGFQVFSLTRVSELVKLHS